MPDGSPLRILGVMTGTSCDGLDAACIEIDLDSFKPLWAESAPYPKALKERVLEFQNPGARHTALSFLELDRDLGEWYGAELAKILSRHPEKPDVIANHGQTLSHHPEPKRKGMTLQAGDPARVAFLTGTTTVSHFRNGDIAAGGQGAPMVPLFHSLLARHLGGSDDGLVIHNLGGISNLTYLGPNRVILAFDTGPGNIWIDAASARATRGKQKFDRGGKLASLGQADLRAVKLLLKHPYFKKPIPKSSGRDDFPTDLFFSKTRARGADLVATATELTIESIAQSYEKFILAKYPLKSAYFCGGGAKNTALLAGLQKRLPQVKFLSLEEAGFDPQLIEAHAFAFFGFLSLLGEPLGGDWTGAKNFGPPGQITPGPNWPELLAKLSDLASK